MSTHSIRYNGLISIVISAFNEEDNVIPLYRAIKEVLLSHEIANFELIFVNDGSTDNTLSKLKTIVNSDPMVRVINFNRNFGHEIAMTAGVDFAAGEAIIFMDSDFQHPPTLLPALIDEWKSGNDIVLTKRTDNLGQNKYQKLRGKLFYKLLNFLSDTEIPPQMPDFRLIDKKYANILKTMKENNRMFRGLISWLGVRNQSVITFSAPDRMSGITKYNLRKLFSLAIDSVVSFSIKPLRIASYLGIIAAFISVILGISAVIEFLTDPNYQFNGYGTTIVMVVFIGSVQLIVLGIVGEYVGRIHMEIKNRPLYIAEYIVHDDLIE